MEARMPFIGRKTELETIKTLLDENNTRRVLWIMGPGGSGKTRLLEEVTERFLQKQTGMIASEIIDFDDRTLHTPENLDRIIAQTIGGQAYKDYSSEASDWRKMEAKDFGPESLGRQSERIYKILIRHLEKASSEKRLILLFDTVEKADPKVWARLFQLIRDSKNIFCLLASRECKDYWQELKSELKNDAELIVWHPMDDDQFAELYIQQKEKNLSFGLPADMHSKLIKLVGGSPILIDMSMEAIARNIVPEPLIKLKPKQIEGMTKKARGKIRSELEAQLVRRVMEMRDSMDQLLLAMSRIYPLDPEMIAVILNVPPENAQALYASARQRIHVKVLPDQRITLHDEVRAMIKNHVWEYIDPQRKRRLRDSRIAVDYFSAQEKRITAELKKIYTEQDKNKSEDYSKEQSLRTALWALREQLLFHTLFIDPGKAGLSTFTRIFDEATRTYNFPYRSILLEEIKPYYNSLTLLQQYEIDNRQIKAHLDLGRYDEAEEIAGRVLKSPWLSPEKRADLLIQYGNIKIRLGRISEGKNFFQEAVDLCRKKKVKGMLVPALNALGWSHRLLGDAENAIAYYKEAQKLSIQTGDKLRQAWILNNLAFVYSQQAKFSPAFGFCEQARELWTELGFKRGMGALYEVYGAIYARMKQNDKAIQYYNLALGQFDSHDYEWLSRIHSGLGLAFRLDKDLAQAEKELNTALDYKIKRDEASILHRLAHVKLEMGEVDTAKRLFEKSYLSSCEISDAHVELNNLGDLAHFAVKEKQYTQLPRFEKLYKMYKKKWPAMSYARAEGMILRHLGDLALGWGPKHYAKAVLLYKKGFALLARFETYQEYSVQAQLQSLEKYWEAIQIKPEVRFQIAQALYKLWDKENLSEQHPEAMSFYVRWMEENSVS